MKIIWRDTELKTHEIDLSNAVDVKINGIRVNETSKGISVGTEGRMLILPVATNRANIEESKI